MNNSTPKELLSFETKVAYVTLLAALGAFVLSFIQALAAQKGYIGAAFTMAMAFLMFFKVIYPIERCFGRRLKFLNSRDALEQYRHTLMLKTIVFVAITLFFSTWFLIGMATTEIRFLLRPMG